jgi:hypothetical protein
MLLSQSQRKKYLSEFELQYSDGVDVRTVNFRCALLHELKGPSRLEGAIA